MNIKIFLAPVTDFNIIFGQNLRGILLKQPIFHHNLEFSLQGFITQMLLHLHTNKFRILNKIQKN